MLEITPLPLCLRSRRARLRSPLGSFKDEGGGRGRDGVSFHQLRYFVLFNHFEGTKCFQKSRTVPCKTEKILILAFNNNNVDKFM